VRRQDGEPAVLPETWSSADDGEFCLGCRRDRAAAAAVEAAPAGIDRSARAQLRRAGLIEFEVRRTPQRTDSSIAKACRSSATAVAAARRRLELSPGPLPNPDRDWAASRPAGRP
jgi:hypothetical protein